MTASDVHVVIVDDDPPVRRALARLLTAAGCRVSLCGSAEDFLVRSYDLATGKEVWTAPAGERLCGTVRGCSAAQGAAVTAMPGIVFAGSMDGGVRAYSTADGKVVWQFDTNREFETVNGVAAKGGAMDGPGPVVSGGMVYVLSGYVSLIGRPGNVLLAFGVD